MVITILIITEIMIMIIKIILMVIIVIIIIMIMIMIQIMIMLMMLVVITHLYARQCTLAEWRIIAGHWVMTRRKRSMIGSNFLQLIHHILNLTVWLDYVALLYESIYILNQNSQCLSTFNVCLPVSLGCQPIMISAHNNIIKSDPRIL